MQQSNAFVGRAVIIGGLFGSALGGCSTAQESTTKIGDASVNASLPITSVSTPASVGVAESITANRISQLPVAQQQSWREYLKRSQEAARLDQAALDAEVKASGKDKALKAPNGGDFKLPAEAGDAWYGGAEAKVLAESILSYQTPAGGWSKHTGYSYGPRKAGMQWTSQNEPGEAPHYLGTFDNRSTTEQLYFLAYIWKATGNEAYKEAFVKGLNYVLEAQFPNGGWPQVYPLEGGYHDQITFNDDAMTRVLGLLQDIEVNPTYYAFLTDDQRAKAALALTIGINCVVKAQVEQDQKKTVWCAQYDALTLTPSRARAMEPATLSGGESARLLELLMSIQKPSPQIVTAIEGGLSWFDKVKVTGIAKEERDGKSIYVANPAATEVYWARFYDLKTSKPIFPGRDGVLYDTFEAMAAKNKLGYDYYTTRPGSLLNRGQNKWRKMLAKSTS